MSRGRWEEMTAGVVNTIGSALEKLPKASKKESAKEKEDSQESTIKGQGGYGGAGDAARKREIERQTEL